MFRRRFADLLLFCVTSIELFILFLLTPTFTITDWIYVLQHLIVLGIALTRPQPKVRDYSLASSIAVGIAYAYPYAQVIYLRWSPGYVASPAAGLVLVTLAAGLSLVSLLTMGRLFGLAGFERSGDEWALQIRSPPDVSLVHTCRHRVQPAGMEFCYAPFGIGWLDVSRLPHSR